jgi:general secretion pathway protein B
MSLLLDALKKSEAQRRRGTSPTIDLTRTPPSGSPRRPGSRWLLVLLAGVLLIAAAPWLWPHVSDWIESRQGGAGEAGQLAEVTNTAVPATGSESQSRGEVQSGVPEKRAAPAPVAGASSPRRVVTDSSPAVVSNTDDGAGPDNAPAEPKVAGEVSDSEAGPSMQELRRVVQAQQQQQQAQPSQPAEPPAEPSRQSNEPAENFIRPWELPQARRAEFPELSLTVHFYAERAAERFVLINGERYREGQRVGPGATLVEIRKRGAVVEFGSYRVLIE